MLWWQHGARDDGRGNGVDDDVALAGVDARAESRKTKGRREAKPQLRRK